MRHLALTAHYDEHSTVATELINMIAEQRRTGGESSLERRERETAREGKKTELE